MYPLVTIAIPTFNRADSYLSKALASAVNQTCKNIEIIVSDNCSSDNTEMVVKNFRDPRIRYFRQQKNIGANNNFNFCLNNATGQFFLLLQDDDLIDHNFVEVCMDAVKFSTEIGIIRTGTRIIDAQGSLIYEIPNTVAGFSTEKFFLGWFHNKTALSYLCSTLFNTEKLREIGGFQSRHNLLQDAFAVVKLNEKFGRIDIHDIKASFRKHPLEMTFAAKVGHWCDEFIDLLDLMCEVVTNNKEIIKTEGSKFFAKLCYNRAQSVKTFPRRFFAHYIVFKKFQYRYPPPYLYDLLYRSPFYSVFRRVKKIIKEYRFT
jgi:glycosyltransferase involved in cell wall biosynthesis